VLAERNITLLSAEQLTSFEPLDENFTAVMDEEWSSIVWSSLKSFWMSNTCMSRSLLAEAIKNGWPVKQVVSFL
jgi:hypothetical protein